MQFSSAAQGVFMNRRELLIQSASSISSLAVGVSIAGTAAAAPSSPAKAASPNYEKLIETTSKCITTGQACLSHCQKELAQGNKVMAECLQSVLELVATCESLQKLASYGSVYTKEQAQLSAKVCGDCAKICEKHAHHMAPCKACMDACKDCEKACQAV